MALMRARPHGPWRVRTALGASLVVFPGGQPFFLARSDASSHARVRVREVRSPFFFLSSHSSAHLSFLLSSRRTVRSLSLFLFLSLSLSLSLFSLFRLAQLSLSSASARLSVTKLD